MPAKEYIHACLSRAVFLVHPGGVPTAGLPPHRLRHPRGFRDALRGVGAEPLPAPIRPQQRPRMAVLLPAAAQLARVAPPVRPAGRGAL